MTGVHRKSAFTLVELLVVSALFLLFFSLVVSAARPKPSSHVRQLAQDLSSAILAAQTRAMSNESGAGLMIAPTGAEIFAAQSLPMITGTVSSWTASASSLTGSFLPTNADSSDLNTCFAIEFFRQTDGMAISPWLTFTPPGTASLDASLTQTTNNTLLLVPASSTALGFAAARHLARGAPAVTVPRFAAIDLRYSGIGMVPTDPFGTLTGSGTVSLRFDRAGCLDKLTRTIGTPATLSPPAPLYLLVAATADITANTALRSPLSRWIAISPDTGRISVALNVVGPYAASPSQADINNARFKVRQAITQGAQ